MAAFLSLVPVGDFNPVPASQARAPLRLVSSRARPAAAHPFAQWQRTADRRLVCRWQPVDPDPLG